ncbi:MAG TPA: hypothetical protein VFT00_00240 [Nocardioides sp.]|nr:hypothetical protein [Nocardioides sp.]
MTRTCALLFASLVLLATGCSSPDADPSSDPSAEVSPRARAIRSGLAELVAGDHPSRRDTRNGACFARALMGRTTPEDLQDAGVLDASYAVAAEQPPLPRELAEVWAASQFECTDFVTESARAQVAISHGKVDGETYATCLREKLTSDEIRAAVVESLIGTFDGVAVNRFSRAQGECARNSHH